MSPAYSVSKVIGNDTTGGLDFVSGGPTLVTIETTILSI